MSGDAVRAVAAAGAAPPGTPAALPTRAEVAGAAACSAEDVVEALLARRMDAELVGGVVVVLGGIARIEAPYGVSQCRSVNETVLGRLRSILAGVEEARMMEMDAKDSSAL